MSFYKTRPIAEVSRNFQPLHKAPDPRLAASSKLREPLIYSVLIGVEKALASPPSEPYVRFSRIRLSSQWFPHRDWLADILASVMVNRPSAAKYIFGQHL